jgi:hypothetical protein
MKETRSPRPVLLAVDDDAHAFAKIEGELSDRHRQGFRVVCEGSAELGIEALKRCKADGEDVALVLSPISGWSLAPSITAEWHVMAERTRVE